jgi:hypothetical protein
MQDTQSRLVDFPNMNKLTNTKKIRRRRRRNTSAVCVQLSEKDIPLKLKRVVPSETSKTLFLIESGKFSPSPPHYKFPRSSLPLLTPPTTHITPHHQPIYPPKLRQNGPPCQPIMLQLCVSSSPRILYMALVGSGSPMAHSGIAHEMSNLSREILTGSYGSRLSFLSLSSCHILLASMPEGIPRSHLDVFD